MLRLKQIKKVKESENKKKLSDELNALNIAKKEFVSVQKIINEASKKLDLKNKEILSFNQQINLYKDKTGKLKNEAILIEDKIVSKKNELIKESSKISLLNTENISKVFESNKLVSKINEGKEILDKLEKKYKVIDSIKNKAIKETIDTDNKKVSLDVKIRENTTILKNQTEKWKEKDKEIKNIDSEILKKKTEHKQLMREMNGERRVLRSDLDFITNDYNEKKQRVIDFNKHMEQKQKEFDMEKRQLKETAEAIQNIRKELKRKWLIMKKGERSNELNNFFN